MKHFLTLIALLPLIACSSAQKSEESNTASAPVADAAPSPQETPATSDPTGASADALEISCTRQHERRTLTVVPKGNGCELFYQKSSGSSVVATAQSGQKHCEEIRGRIRKNLEKVAFTCK